MRLRLRTVILAGVVALGGLIGAAAGEARAQVVVNTPAAAVGVGVPAVGAYPAYGSGYGYAPAYRTRGLFRRGYAPRPYRVVNTRTRYRYRRW